MATGTAHIIVNGADIDTLCDDLELEAGITTAQIAGIFEEDGYTNSAAIAVNRVEILITGTTDAAITAAVAAVGSLQLVTHADVTEDSET